MDGPTFDLWISTHESGPGGRRLDGLTLSTHRHQTLSELLVCAYKHILSTPTNIDPGLSSPINLLCRASEPNPSMADPAMLQSIASIHDVRLWYSTDMSTDWKLVNAAVTSSGGPDATNGNQRETKARQVRSLQVGDINVMHAPAPRLMLEIRPRGTDVWVRPTPLSSEGALPRDQASFADKSAPPTLSPVPDTLEHGVARTPALYIDEATSLHIDDSANADTKWRAQLKVDDIVDVYDCSIDDWREGAIASVGVAASAIAARQSKSDSDCLGTGCAKPENAVVVRFRGSLGHRLCTSRFAGAPGTVAEKPSHGDIAPPYVHRLLICCHVLQQTWSGGSPKQYRSFAGSRMSPIGGAVFEPAWK